MSDTLTITPPSFKATVPMLRLMVEDGSVDARDFAWEEVTRWAAMLDEAAKAERAALADMPAAPSEKGKVLHVVCGVCCSAPASTATDRGVFLCDACAKTANEEWGA